MNILILEQSDVRCEQLVSVLEQYLSEAGQEATFFRLRTQEVFRKTIHKDVDLAFIVVNSMADMEAARQFHRLYNDIPFWVVSDSKEYAVESFRFPAKGYLIRPIDSSSAATVFQAV